MKSIAELFEIQKALDDRIRKEHNLEGVDLTTNTILALQVELAELANEWRGFKHWSKDQNPRPKMLEEYVDCLHFFLSLGLQLKINKTQNFHVFGSSKKTITQKFISLIEQVAKIETDQENKSAHYLISYNKYFELGESLGLSYTAIEEAYLQKNQINHDRQDMGY